MHFQYIFEIRSCLLATYELPNFDFSFFVLWRWDNVIFEGLLAPMQHKVSNKSQNFIRHLNACPKIFFGCYRISFFQLGKCIVQIWGENKRSKDIWRGAAFKSFKSSRQKDNCVTACK